MTVARALALVVFLAAVASVTAQYVESDAIQAARYTGAAYCQAHWVEQWNCPSCKLLPYLNATVFYSSLVDTTGFVGYDPAANRIYIVFRGTNPLSIQDWIDDILISPIKPYANCENCEVHSGFDDCWQDMRPDVDRLTHDLLARYPNATLHVTGHSLGAAIAQLCAVDMTLSLNVSMGAIYTFGEPRVGNQAFRDFYVATLPNGSWRVIHYADPVPHLPWESMGYYHEPTEVWYTEAQDSYTVCDRSGEDPSCSDSLLVPILVTDHLNYLSFDYTANYLECAL